MAADLVQLQRQEKRAGLILIGAAAAALILANSPLADAYQHLLEFKFGPPMPRFGLLSVHYWIADGLMAVFFLLVGLEVKREWYDGRLSTPAERRLPIVAAAAGMAVPALIYLSVTGFEPSIIRGWAIPAATDIAFAVGVLALLGARANPAIKLLLVTIAIVDDVGAVIIIALAYTADLSAIAIGAAVLILGAMAALNLFGVRRLWPYMIGFVFLWYAMLASGIHATIAGVLAALTIPLGLDEDHSPLKRLEHAIHPWVMFGVMPLFGLASAGVELGNFRISNPLPIAIMLGLFVGKQIGVFGAIWATVRSGLAPRPDHARWSELYGASALCGIGFTMSLFIGALAFPASQEEVEAAKVGTLAGSLLSAILGYAVLRFVAQKPIDDRESAEAREIFGGDQPEDERS
ncbi:Na+/H+ antiporter NhaA [Sphingomonas sp. SM33]|uniref:Na(+)/H(+) antiporter NhaA n=1 Tax=Sphingomonas telluris TaxID=2907998 RepID=A0ABS9VPZ1_9SPHN|nr:Na+/H+ antiporter NhaA [Sphingomonas telluris]MCH8617046.1 Na+/H+ antiporter NhaA [Sphingomonas telluris]